MASPQEPKVSVRFLTKHEDFQRCCQSVTYVGTWISLIISPYIYGSVKRNAKRFTDLQNGPTVVGNLLAQIQSLGDFPLLLYRIKIYLGKIENIMIKLCVAQLEWFIYLLYYTFLVESKLKGQYLLIRGYQQCMAAHNTQKLINVIHHHVNLVEARRQMMNSVSA